MTMDHAAAHEELADLALEPHRLRRLEADDTPTAVAFRAHLGACPDCRTELEAWRRVYGALDIATEAGAMPLRSLESSEAPAPSAALRDRTLAGVRVSPREATIEARIRVGQPARARRFEPARLPARLARLGWLAAAAALIVAVGVGGLVVERSGEADQARREAAEVAAATASIDRILAAPTHWVVTLHTADGAAGGTLAWSSSEVVVLTSALSPGAPGTTYRCWIERGGTRTPVGTMSFSGGLGYWAGSTASWGALGKGSRFGVTAVAGSDSGGGSAVLVGEL